jgi:hypothetical protein
MDFRSMITVLENIESPEEMQAGDVLELELSEDVVLEATIIDCYDDTIVISGSEKTLEFLSEQGQTLEEAKYQGRTVPLGKPMKGDVKKSKVYVKGPKGNVVKVNFGDKKLSIKKHIPGRRKNFRARHNCDNPGPRWKARYWSCRAW